MKLLFYIFLVTVFTLIASRSIDMQFELTNNNVPHSGYCYSTMLGVGAMEKYEYKTAIGQCIWAVCDNDTTVYYGGCGKWKIPTNCKLFAEDLSKPYPDCCPYVDCS